MRVQAIHQFEDTDQSVHAKMTVPTAMKIFAMTMERQQRNPSHKRKDYFGTGDKLQKE